MIRETISIDVPSMRTIEGLLEAAADFGPEQGPPAELAERALCRWRADRARSARRRRAAAGLAVVVGLALVVFTLPRAREGPAATLAWGRQPSLADFRESPLVPRELPTLVSVPDVPSLSGGGHLRGRVPRRIDGGAVASSHVAQRNLGGRRHAPTARWTVQVVRQEVIHAVRPGWVVAGEGAETRWLPGYLETVVALPVGASERSLNLASQQTASWEEPLPVPEPPVNEPIDTRKDDEP